MLGLYAASTLGAQGAQALAAAFNKKHGLSIKVKTRDVGKIVGLAASGVEPRFL